MASARCSILPLAITLAAAILSTGLPDIAQSADAPSGELPAADTVRSLLLNNWSDALAIHYSRQLAKDDSRLFGPYLSGLHDALDWPVNQIDGATAFFRADIAGGGSNGAEQPPTLCESGGDAKGDDAPADPGLRYSYPSIMCFDDGGVLNVEYLRETERGLPIQITKSYAFAPHRRFLVVRYTLTNNVPLDQNKSVHLRFAEVVDLNNKNAPDHEESHEDLVDTGINDPQPGLPIEPMHAQWQPELNAWIADMSASNGVFLIFGALQGTARHRVFQPVADDIEFDRAIASEMDAFDGAELPTNVDDQSANDLGMALYQEGDLGPGSMQQYSFYYAVAKNLDEARQIAAEARQSGNAESWFNETRAAYRAWLQQGRRIAPPDPALATALNRALITSKQAQQPEFGSFVAATNPAYGFKVWPRDSSMTALGLAAAGHLEEAIKFYRWLASVQENGSDQQHPLGTWFTNYGYWARKRPKTFVEPEWDALGLFMIGVYHTWRLLNERDPQAAQKFLSDPLEGVAEAPGSVYDAVRRSAEYIKNNVNEQHYGPGDFSIWEEQFAWNTFTQVTYASGLDAARLLATAMGETDHAQAWDDAAKQILDTIHRSVSTQPCPGPWHDGESRWIRAVWIDCTRDDRLDSATDLAWVFGLVDANDPRADAHRNAVLARLTPGDDDIGIARYEGDEFYHANNVSPGGTFEANASMPSWPQMDMYMCMLEHWRGLDDVALQRLLWYVRVTNVGYMPPGEAVDWTNDRPLASTSSEPATAAWYMVGLLNYLGVFDPRLPPL
jgi:hypothetical protein